MPYFLFSRQVGRVVNKKDQEVNLLWITCRDHLMTIPGGVQVEGMIHSGGSRWMRRRGMGPPTTSPMSESITTGMPPKQRGKGLASLSRVLSTSSPCTCAGRRETG